MSDSQGAEENVAEGSSPQAGKRTPKKVWFPFGTSSHTKHAFSDFCHLSGDARIFAEDLATATGVTPEIRGSPTEEYPTSGAVKQPKKKAPPPKVKINAEMLQDLLQEGTRNQPWFIHHGSHSR